ncbi:hypothetical protein PAXRUDRAFT_733708 [Paxillus rubicundulus Ve08.2h10]|uniref:Uncharacterized protein n=1 Tax=Paxillus rubicundulus Ve08.2h10 TaxID=930991 RepID=A0A0D0DK16_9AGAM|nr:hypothetical protein PAXRUDRAFT_733708 [Paxillus rubicundulus Ve08.2h10]
MRSSILSYGEIPEGKLMRVHHLDHQCRISSPGQLSWEDDGMAGEPCKLSPSLISWKCRAVCDGVLGQSLPNLDRAWNTVKSPGCDQRRLVPTRGILAASITLLA